MGRFGVTKCCRALEGTVGSRLEIEVMSNPDLYSSSTSSKVHVSGSHWTRNSYTHVDRRLWRMRLSSKLDSVWCMAALFPGESLPLRGCIVGRTFRLRSDLFLAIKFLPLAGKSSVMQGPQRVPSYREGKVGQSRGLSMES